MYAYVIVIHNTSTVSGRRRRLGQDPCDVKLPTHKDVKAAAAIESTGSALSIVEPS